jgi:hypothetical protein
MLLLTGSPMLKQRKAGIPYVGLHGLLNRFSVFFCAGRTNAGSIPRTDSPDQAGEVSL